MVIMRMAVTRERARLISIAALAAATGMFAEAAEATTLAAWVQLVGRDGAASIRAITDGATCPSLSVDGTAVRMRVRAEPGPLFADASSLPHADFPIRVCEAAAEPKTKVVLDGKDLPVPRSDIRRIVVFGDTGCRIKKKKVQDCNNADEWPYATLARHAAAAKPDVVIHVGDYLYRETPCSPQVKHCPNSPTGYGWNTWNADFFTPSQPLFAAAPWVMLRGNHEVCDRAGEGWFRFLDHARMSPNCLAMSDFFVVTAGTFGFAVADSALVAGADKMMTTTMAIRACRPTRPSRSPPRCATITMRSPRRSHRMPGSSATCRSMPCGSNPATRWSTTRCSGARSASYCRPASR